MPTTRRVKVSPLENPADFKCILHCDEGMSANFISRETGLTKSQVGYTLRKYGYRISTYRNGASLTAQAVLQHGRQMVGYALEQQLRDRIGNRTD